MDKVLKCNVVKIVEDKINFEEEQVIREYPLTIEVNGEKVTTLLCSPENIKELVFGFLATEQIIKTAKDVLDFKFYEDKCLVTVDIIDSELKFKNIISKKTERDDDKEYESIYSKITNSVVAIKIEKIFEFMKINLEHSDTFKNTGGAHCIALCDNEKPIFICEDVARHNAMDKVIGSAIINDVFLKDKILVLSGRVSLEMISKAAKLQIPIILSKSAPTNLSVNLAKQLDITLVGFIRGNRMNVYSRPDRIVNCGNIDLMH